MCAENYMKGGFCEIAGCAFGEEIRGFLPKVIRQNTEEPP